MLSLCCYLIWFISIFTLDTLTLFVFSRLLWKFLTQKISRLFSNSPSIKYSMKFALKFDEHCLHVPPTSVLFSLSTANIWIRVERAGCYFFRFIIWKLRKHSKHITTLPASSLRVDRSTRSKFLVTSKNTSHRLSWSPTRAHQVIAAWQINCVNSSC